MALRDLRSGLKHRIHAAVDGYGLHTDSITDLFGRRGRESLATRLAEFPPETARMAEVQLCALAHIETIEQRIHAEIAPTPEVQLLLSVPGVGEILAPVIGLEIGDVNRFPRAEASATTDQANGKGDPHACTICAAERSAPGTCSFGCDTAGPHRTSNRRAAGSPLEIRGFGRRYSAGRGDCLRRAFRHAEATAKRTAHSAWPGSMRCACSAAISKRPARQSSRSLSARHTGRSAPGRGGRRSSRIWTQSDSNCERFTAACVVKLLILRDGNGRGEWI